MSDTESDVNAETPEGSQAGEFTPQPLTQTHTVHTTPGVHTGTATTATSASPIANGQGPPAPVAAVPPPEVNGHAPWKAFALLAGIGEFEGAWLPPLDHAVSDTQHVAEFLHQAGYTAVVDLANETLYRPSERPAPHRCGQLSHWELRRHFQNALDFSKDGLVLLYLQTRAMHSVNADKTRPPDTVCTFNDGSAVKLTDFITDLADAARGTLRPGGRCVVVLDLQVEAGVNHELLPNLSSLCPPNFAAVVSMTPERASVFTPKFLSALSPGAVAGGVPKAVTLKDVAWSERMSSELSAIAAACYAQEERARVAPAARRWHAPTWVPVTAAASLDDPVMSYPLTSPALGGVFVEESTHLLVSLTKAIKAEGSLPAAFSKLKDIDSVLGRGLSGDSAIVSMQPIQCVVDTQSTSTPLKAWEDFRSEHGLSTASLQHHESHVQNRAVPANHMRFYIKFGTSYELNSLAEQELRQLETAYSRSNRMYFGTDPRADRDPDDDTTVVGCKIRTLYLRVEATYKVTASTQLPILAESRAPPQVSPLMQTRDGAAYELETLKLRALLPQDATGIRHKTDVAFHKKQSVRIGDAQKIDISRAMQSNQQGIVHPSERNRGLVEYLQVSQDVQIECAIRIQSVIRMFFVRKKFIQLQWQLGDVPYDGQEMRFKVRQWLLAAAHQLQWQPTSAPVVIFCDTGGSSTYNPDDDAFRQRVANANRCDAHREFILRNVVQDACRELDLPTNPKRIHLEGVSAQQSWQRVVVRLTVLSTWVGHGDAVPVDVRTSLDALAARLKMAFEGRLKEAYKVSKVTVNQSKVLKACPHVDLRTVTPDKAIRSVLSGPSAREPIPASVRRILERGVEDPATAKQNMVVVLLSDPDCSVPYSWQRTILEAPLLPGASVCHAPTTDVLQRVLQTTPEQRERAKKAAEYMKVQDILYVARSRADREDLVYELPGVRQLAKTPMILYSKFWSDKGYYEDEDVQFAKLAEEQRAEAMMSTVRYRAQIQREYQTHLWHDLWEVAKQEIGPCRLAVHTVATSLLLIFATVMVFLLPKWASNIVALLYVENHTSMTLENIMTWLVLYGLVLFLALLALGLLDGYGRHLLAYKMRALFVYICAKYNNLFSAQMVTTLREHDIRKAVQLLFGDVVKVAICLLGLVMCLGHIFSMSITLGLIVFLYILFKLCLHVTYDRFMTRHMTALSNIQKEEQLRWVVLKGPAGAAGHVAAQAADDHQMRLRLFSREKQDVHTMNLVVHTCVAVLDWMIMFCLPVFYLYVAAHEVSNDDPGAKGSMWQQADQIPEAVFYYFTTLLFWRYGLEALVGIVENRPAILRLLTVLTYVELTPAERDEMHDVMSLKKGDAKLLERINEAERQAQQQQRDRQQQTTTAPGEAYRAQGDAESSAGEIELQPVVAAGDAAGGGDPGNAPPAPSNSYRVKKKGWYKKRLLVEFDWYSEILAQNSSSGSLMYLCYLCWVIFTCLVVYFVITSWSSECKPVEATCIAYLEGYNTTANITVAQVAPDFALGECTLMAPVSYLLHRCAIQQQYMVAMERGSVSAGHLRVAIEYPSWQDKLIGFTHTFKWNETHPDLCPVDDSPWYAYRVQPFRDVYEEGRFDEIFPAECNITRYRP